jgi:steroid delta-isomerase-like uncharacterized protein
MASRDDTEALIRRYYDAFNRGDIEGMLACVTDDIVHDVNQGERRTGKDRFHAFCARMAHHYKEQLTGIVVMASADGQRAAAEFNVEGQYLQTETGLPPAAGQRYGLPAGAFFAVREEHIARVTTYYNLTDWIMQVTEGPPS